MRLGLYELAVIGGVILLVVIVGALGLRLARGGDRDRPR